MAVSTKIQVLRTSQLRVLRATKNKRPLPRSSTANCHWPPGWDFAGERARPGGGFRRRAVRTVPQRRRRGIFVEPKPK